MAYTTAMKSEVANTIGSKNMRKGRKRATDKTFLRLCSFGGARGVGLAEFPTQALSFFTRRACRTGPYVSARLSRNAPFRVSRGNLPGTNKRGTKETPANARATQYSSLQLTGDTKPAMMGPLVGPMLTTYYQISQSAIRDDPYTI